MKTLRWYSPRPVLLVLVFAAFGGCKTSAPSSPIDNPPTVSITSPGASKVLRMTDTVFVNASDDVGITKAELYINGSLSATDNAAPWRFIWDTEQWSDGTYSIQVKVYDGAGHTGTSPAVSVSIKNAFPATFINTVFTPITITVSSVVRTIQPGDSTTYTLTTNPRSLVFNASTSGKTSSNTQIGLLISWGGSLSSIDVSSMQSYRARLIISSSYFFLYMTNTGKTTLGPIYVNYGLTDQTTDNILIPGDGLTYQTGYYKSFTNTQVRAFWSSPNASTYTFWNQGTHFTLPFTTNQSVVLSNTLPTSQMGLANFDQTDRAPFHGPLTPARSVTQTKRIQIPEDGAALIRSRE